MEHLARRLQCTAACDCGTAAADGADGARRGFLRALVAAGASSALASCALPTTSASAGTGAARVVDTHHHYYPPEYQKAWARLGRQAQRSRTSRRK